MQENYSVANHLAGTVHIDRVTGTLRWDRKNLDPVIQRYVKRHLFDEGFIEQAIGMLDPALDPKLAGLLQSLEDPSS